MSLQHLLILKLSVAVRALQMAVLLCLKDISEDVRNFWRSVLLLDSVHDMLRNIDIAHHLLDIVFTLVFKDVHIVYRVQRG